MTENNSSFLSYINSSGFAFQMRVEEEVLRQPNQWRFAGREHRWQDESGQSGYIDLLVDFGALRMLIECKKQKDKNWIFLKAKSSQQKDKCILLWSKKYEPIEKTTFPTNFMAWDNFSITPASYSSPFCTMQGQGDNSRTLLEKTASELTHASECLAKEELAFTTKRGLHHPKIYMPIIVTNATLKICSFVPQAIDISTGELLLENVDFETVPYIRFQKGLETNTLSSHAQTEAQQEPELKDINSEKERTVFVVNSNHLYDFLRSCNLNNSVHNPLPWVAVDQIYSSAQRG